MLKHIESVVCNMEVCKMYNVSKEIGDRIKLQQFVMTIFTQEYKMVVSVCLLCLETALKNNNIWALG